VAKPDYIIVGSGMNSLVCAAVLARKGLSVLVLEREDTAGGCIKTGEVTLPGFKHDLMSGFYPEFIAGAAFAELGEELGQHGLEFCNTTHPCGTVFADGRSFILKTDRAANVEALNALAEGDGDRFNADMDDFGANAHLSFGLLGNELLSWQVVKLLGTEVWKSGLDHLLSFFGHASRTARTWASQFQSEEARATFTPWVLHAGMDPDGTMSSYMARVFTFALEAAGMPVVRGESANMVRAFEGLITARGGDVRTGADVAEIMMSGSRASGVKLTGGETIECARGVICNVVPQRLYGESGLLPASQVPVKVREQARVYRYGRGNMIIHLALDGVPQWSDPELAKVAMLHMHDSIEQTTQSLAQVKAGLLPARATLAVAQKPAVDPSRVPDGKWSLWLQLHEIPRDLKGDAAGEIDCINGWSEAVRESYADRIIAQLAEYIPDLPGLILGRNVYSPKDLEAMNCNLVGGDPYSGVNELDQFLLWRPLRSLRGHKTPVKNVFHIGASTHPGPGLGGGSGYLVGSQLS